MVASCTHIARACPAHQPENAVEFSQFIGSIRDPEVARGYEALAVESVWVGTYQHRASCVARARNPCHPQCALAAFLRYLWECQKFCLMTMRTLDDFSGTLSLPTRNSETSTRCEVSVCVFSFFRRPSSHSARLHIPVLGRDSVASRFPAHRAASRRFPAGDGRQIRRSVVRHASRASRAGIARSRVAVRRLARGMQTPRQAVQRSPSRTSQDPHPRLFPTGLCLPDMKSMSPIDLLQPWAPPGQ